MRAQYLARLRVDEEVEFPYGLAVTVVVLPRCRLQDLSLFKAALPPVHHQRADLNHSDAPRLASSAVNR
jgi:hypothetical protein